MELNGLTIRGGLQCVFGCRFEGQIDPAVVLDLVKEQLDLGIDEVALADSTGMADPNSIQEISVKVMELAQGIPVFLHLHDTEGKDLANALAALQVSVNHFDTAFGGMGGVSVYQRRFGQYFNGRPGVHARANGN